MCGCRAGAHTALQLKAMAGSIGQVWQPCYPTLLWQQGGQSIASFPSSHFKK